MGEFKPKPKGDPERLSGGFGPVRRRRGVRVEIAGARLAARPRRVCSGAFLEECCRALARPGPGSPGRTRTSDQSVNSRLLYQLSYRGSGGVATILDPPAQFPAARHARRTPAARPVWAGLRGWCKHHAAWDLCGARLGWLRGGRGGFSCSRCAFSGRSAPPVPRSSPRRRRCHNARSSRPCARCGARGQACGSTIPAASARLGSRHRISMGRRRPRASRQPRPRRRPAWTCGS